MLDARIASRCHEWIHKTYARNAFAFDTEASSSLMSQKRAELGMKHEARVLGEIRKVADDLGLLLIDCRSSEDETLAALSNPKISIILGGRIGAQTENSLSLPISNKISKPDVFFRVQDGWIPVDVKSHTGLDKTNTKNSYILKMLEIDSLANFDPNFAEMIPGKLSLDDALQLSHYYLHLKTIGFAATLPFGGVIGADGENIVLQDLSRPCYSSDSALTIYSEAFAEAKHVFEKSVSRNADPDLAPAAKPFWKTDCKECEFQKICILELQNHEDVGHISLIAGVTEKVAQELGGISNIKEAARLVESSDPKLMQIGLKAQVWLDRNPRLLNPAANLDLPIADIEIDIDLENSMAVLFGDEAEAGLEDYVFQYGWLRLLNHEEQDWREAETGVFEDFRNSAAADFEVQLNMWNWMNTEVTNAETSGKTIKFFHYSPHERSWWKKFAKRYENRLEVPSLENVEKFISDYFVDMLPSMRKIAFPAKSYSIKDLAPLADFEWQVDDPGGDKALIHFLKAVELEDSPERSAAREWLTTYNRGDVQATAAVRQWVRSTLNHL